MFYARLTHARHKNEKINRKPIQLVRRFFVYFLTGRFEQNFGCLRTLFHELGNDKLHHARLE